MLVYYFDMPVAQVDLDPDDLDRQVWYWTHPGCWDYIGQIVVAYCNMDPDL